MVNKLLFSTAASILRDFVFRQKSILRVFVSGKNAAGRKSILRISQK